MIENVVNQLQRRALTGSRIKNFTVTCERCPRMRYREYCLQICEHIFYNSEGLHDIMWELPSGRVESKERYCHECDMWYHRTFYIIEIYN